MEKWLKPALIGGLLAGLLGLAYQVLQNFVTPFIWAVILVYTSWPLHQRLLHRWGQRANLAALGMVLGLLTALIVPLAWFSLLLQSEVISAYHDAQTLLSQKPAAPEWLYRLPMGSAEAVRGFEQLSDPDTWRARWLPWLRNSSGPLLHVLGNVGYNAAQLAIALFSAFFLYRDGLQVSSQVIQVMHRLLDERIDAYLSTAASTVKAVVYGLVLTALGQATVAGLGYWMVGAPSPVLLTLITALFAMIPFGTPVVWVSVGVWLLLRGDYWAGVELLIWGSAVVSWVDNVIRPLVISANTRIPFLLVFFGVLGGLAAYGFVGLFVGPVILAVLLAVWREWLEQQATTS